MKPVAVSQLNSYIRRVLATDPILSNISVVGEISNLKHHSTGVYFSLKDSDSKVSCYIPPSILRQLRYELDEGMEIIAHGYINVYERGGTYSINIKDIEMQGTGDLAKAFKKLKTKLAAEGLFDPIHKKELPLFPSKVAVITSPTGAAVEDIKKIIRSRNLYVDILIVPVMVQGQNAASSISHAIYEVNRLFPETDVMIVGRGGGSMEELWAFNEEIVARAIFASEIPVISAVGHETDFTIADFVADFRAETPTAAAALAVPDIEKLKTMAKDSRQRLLENLEACIIVKKHRLETLDIGNLQKRLTDRITISRLKCDTFKNTLEHLSPKNIMERGYSAFTREDGSFIKSSEELKVGQTVRTVMKDGTVLSEIKEIRR